MLNSSIAQSVFHIFKTDALPFCLHLLWVKAKRYLFLLILILPTGCWFCFGVCGGSERAGIWLNLKNVKKGHQERDQSSLNIQRMQGDRQYKDKSVRILIHLQWDDAHQVRCVGMKAFVSRDKAISFRTRWNLQGPLTLPLPQEFAFHEWPSSNTGSWKCE